MEYLFLLLGLTQALWITHADMYERMVPVLALLGFSLAGIGWQWTQGGSEALWMIWPTLGLLGSIWGGIWLFFRWKGHQNIMNSALGWGDVWMMAALACWGATEAWIWFHCLVFVGAALGYGWAVRKGRIGPDYPVPLAGILAAAFSVCFPLYHWFLT